MTEQEQEYQEFLEEQRRLEELEHYAVGIDEDILQDDLICAIVGEISDNTNLVVSETTQKDIPLDDSKEQSQEQSQETSQGTSVEAVSEEEMRDDYKYIMEHMEKGNRYINKSDIVDIHKNYDNNVALFQKQGQSEGEAIKNAKKIKYQALDELCKNAKKFDKSALREMQFMSGKHSRSYDVVHFSKGKDGSKKCAEVRVGGHVLTAKQVKQMNKEKTKSQDNERDAKSSVRGISNNARSYIGGDAQSQTTATIMITANVLMAAIHTLMKTSHDARLWMMESKIKKSIEIGQDIDLAEIKKQIDEETSKLPKGKKKNDAQQEEQEEQEENIQENNQENSQENSEQEPAKEESEENKEEPSEPDEIKEGEPDTSVKFQEEEESIDDIKLDSQQDEKSEAKDADKDAEPKSASPVDKTTTNGGEVAKEAAEEAKEAEETVSGVCESFSSSIKPEVGKVVDQFKDVLGKDDNESEIEMPEMGL